MIQSIFMLEQFREAIAAEARAALPRECCGLLVGGDEPGGLRICSIHPTRNLAREPDRFEIDPSAHFSLLRSLRGTTQRVIGCYHSHPFGAAQPSPHDQVSSDELGFVWVIAAIATGKIVLQAYVREAGGFRGLILA